MTHGSWSYSKVGAAAGWLFLSISIFILLRVNSTAFVGDDAYMTFRVSKNLLAGNGFVCNPGEYVLSTTTPLWAFGVAVWSFIRGADPAAIFRELSYSFDFLNILLMFWLGSARGARVHLGGMASTLFALSWHANYSSIIGMESPLFVCLLLLTAASYERRFLAALLASASFLCRPEGALLCLALTLLRVL